MRQFYRRQMFFPGWAGIFVNPFYFARAGLAAAMTECASALSGRLLDIGCGDKPYRELFHVDAYVGLELDSEVARKRGIADCFYDGGEFPFPKESFDAALCNQVLEHVFNPDHFLREVNRVLKSGGKLILTVPFIWDEHEQPFDYARYSSFGLRALLERNGFLLLKHMKLGADASVVSQLANAYLFKVTRNWPSTMKLVLTTTLMAAINILGVAARRFLPDNPDLFLDQAVLAAKRS